MYDVMQVVAHTNIIHVQDAVLDVASMNVLLQ